MRLDLRFLTCPLFLLNPPYHPLASLLAGWGNKMVHGTMLLIQVFLKTLGFEGAALCLFGFLLKFSWDSLSASQFPNLMNERLKRCRKYRNKLVCYLLAFNFSYLCRSFEEV